MKIKQFEHTLEDIEMIRQGKEIKPDILSARVGDQAVIVKRITGKPAWYRIGLGRWLLSREARILQRLEGIEGIPAFWGMQGNDALVMALVPGQVPYEQAAFNRQTLALLFATVTAMHRRNVVHCDLRTRTNYLVDDEGKGYLIDFNLSYFRDSGFWFRPLKHLFFCSFQATDLRGLRKLAESCLPGEVLPDYLNVPEPLLEQLGHRLKRVYQRIKSLIRRVLLRSPGEAGRYK